MPNALDRVLSRSSRCSLSFEISCIRFNMMCSEPCMVCIFRISSTTLSSASAGILGRCSVLSYACSAYDRSLSTRTALSTAWDSWALPQASALRHHQSQGDHEFQIFCPFFSGVKRMGGWKGCCEKQMNAFTLSMDALLAEICTSSPVSIACLRRLQLNLWLSQSQDHRWACGLDKYNSMLLKLSESKGACSSQIA